MPTVDVGHYTTLLHVTKLRNYICCARFEALNDSEHNLSQQSRQTEHAVVLQQVSCMVLFCWQLCKSVFASKLWTRVYMDRSNIPVQRWFGFFFPLHSHRKPISNYIFYGLLWFSSSWYCWTVFSILWVKGFSLLKCFFILTLYHLK